MYISTKENLMNEKLIKPRRKRKRKNVETDDSRFKFPFFQLRQVSSTILNEYNMQHKNRGKAIIFNQYYCYGHAARRVGAEFDVCRLAEILTTILNFEVRIYNDLTYIGITDVLRNLSKSYFAHDDCLAIFVFTHGTRFTLAAADQKYPTEEIWQNFTPRKCPTLDGKPKLFFINACRGKKIDEGFLYRSMKDGTELEQDTDFFRAPLYSDFLIFYSTMDEYQAIRETDQGSWFIQSLCNILENKKYRRLELKDILTLTTRKTALINQKGRVTQIPTMMSTLLRSVYFFGK